MNPLYLKFIIKTLIFNNISTTYTGYKLIINTFLNLNDRNEKITSKNEFVIQKSRFLNWII